MKKQKFTLFVFIALLWMFGLVFPSLSNAGMNVDITIPVPGLVVPAPPATSVIPGIYAYYQPDLEADIFFYHGYWYHPYRGQWFISTGYNGPWGAVAIRRVPRPLLGMPSHFRRAAYYEQVPYGAIRKNWRTWKQDHY